MLKKIKSEIKELDIKLKEKVKKKIKQVCNYTIPIAAVEKPEFQQLVQL